MCISHKSSQPFTDQQQLWQLLWDAPEEHYSTCTHQLQYEKYNIIFHGSLQVHLIVGTGHF